MSFSKSHKWINAQSDIWETGAAPEGEFVLLPVGLPPLITTSQELLLANSPVGGGEGYGTTSLWYPNPWDRTPSDAYVSFGTLISGEDFFPFYRNGVFWSPRRVKSMIMNGLLIDSDNANHAACFELPTETTDGFYRISLIAATPSSTFSAIINLVAGQTLALTDITLYTP